MSDSDKTKIGWAPEPSNRYIGPSFVLENTSTQLLPYLQPEHVPTHDFTDEPTKVVSPRFARGSYPQCEPYALSPFAAASQLARAPTEPADVLTSLPTRVVSRYPIHPRARRHSELTVEIDAARAHYARRVYSCVLAALLAFGGLVYVAVTNATVIRHVSAPAVKLVIAGRWNWAVVLGTFVVVSWLATVWSHNMRSRAAACLGLVGYVIAMAVALVPLLAVLVRATDQALIAREAAIATLATFSLLVLSIALGKQRFSFVRSNLVVTLAAGAAVGGMVLFGDATPGMACAVGAVWLATLHMVRRTSYVFEYYVDRHIAAALALVASIVLLPFQLLRMVLR